VLLSTVVARNLRSAFPGARIDILTEAPAEDIVRNIPEFDEAIIFRPRKDSILRLFLELRRARYDLVFDLFCNPRSAQMAFATGARIRVGYPFRGRAWAYNAHVGSRSDRVHNTEFNLDALAALDIPVTDRTVTWHPPAAVAAWADEYLKALDPRRPLIALNSGGTWETKRWGLRNFARLGDALAERRRATVLLLWGPGEEQDAAAVRDMMHSEAVVIPPTSIAQLGALLARCDALIANDTGPMHIGAAVGLPVLGIFGPTNPYLQGPFNASSAWVRREGLDCIACNLTSCAIGNVCMTELDPETVLNAFDRIFPQ